MDNNCCYRNQPKSKSANPPEDKHKKFKSFDEGEGATSNFDETYGTERGKSLKELKEKRE